MRIGCVGLGHIGYHFAANLLAAGHEVTVHDIRPEVAEPLLAAGEDAQAAPAARRGSATSGRMSWTVTSWPAASRLAAKW